MNLLYKRPVFACFSVLYLTKAFVVETSYHCNFFVSVLLECALSLLMAPPPLCAEFPPPLAVRVTPRYVVLDTSADLVLEAKFRGSFSTHEWVYNQDDPTFQSGVFSLFTPATVTNVGQTYTIPAGSASLRVGYYGPRVTPTLTGTNIRPTPENTVTVGSFGKCTTTDSVAPQVRTLSELIFKQEMVVVLTHYMNTYVHKHQSRSSGILIMLGVPAVVGYICKV